MAREWRREDGEAVAEAEAEVEAEAGERGAV
jgi:hypothetical protein